MQAIIRTKIYKTLNAALYNVLFVNVMEYHLKSYISLQLMPAKKYIYLFNE